MWRDLPVSPCEAILFAQPCIPRIQNRPVCSKFLRIRALLVGGGRGGTGYGRSYARNVWAPTDGGGRQFMLPGIKSVRLHAFSHHARVPRVLDAFQAHPAHLHGARSPRLDGSEVVGEPDEKGECGGIHQGSGGPTGRLPADSGGGNKRCSQTSTRPETGGQSDLGGIDTMPGEHAHLPLWPPQLWNEECSEEVATKSLSVLSLKDFQSSPRTVVVDFGALLMQVCPPFRLFLGWLA